MTDSRRVLVAMSGGVDSSVAAALLVEAGHEVVGVTMKTFCYSDTPANSRTCCGLDGIQDAQRVADALEIPHYVFDVEEQFTRDVIDDFVSEYAHGRTPNPCVRCNSNTKFRDLLQRGRALGTDLIATGHYARTEVAVGGDVTLHRGVDLDKDQAYFLWGLPAALVPQLRFPLGRLTKPEVRQRARDLGLVTADKPESQEICFVPTGNYRDLLGKRLGARHPALQEGPFVDRAGNRLGTHQGYAGYTVGQRKGLPGGFEEPRYVLEVVPQTRTVVLGRRDELLSDEVRVEELNWLTSPVAPGSGVLVQMRHRARAVAASVAERDDRGLTLRLDVPQAAVTPGQSAALYRSDQLLGGGRIRGAGLVGEPAGW